MHTAHLEYPRLRPVEAIHDPESRRVILRDPTQLAAGLIVVAETDLVLLSLLNGRRRRMEIQSDYTRHSGELLPTSELDDLLSQLDSAGFLAGAGFEMYYERLVDEYHAAPFRPLRDPDSFGAPAAELGKYLDAAIAAARAEGPVAQGGPRLRGIVTPHLDFPRGLPCYSAGFAGLREGPRPRRVVILGTNHYGRADSVVATSKDFQTHWGVVPTDREFLARLGAECAGNLMPYELDHLREHSIELQVVWLHHLLGDGFSIVPVLVPDPTGPRGTAAGDEGCVDTREFALALGRLLRDDPEPTLIVASADLSHVGRYFGDRRSLTDTFLRSIEKRDEAALALVDRNDPEGFREHMAGTGNPTRVCSVGCLYAAMTALGPDIRAERLRYHQASTPELENCVTSAAYAFYS